MLSSHSYETELKDANTCPSLTKGTRTMPGPFSKDAKILFVMVHGIGQQPRYSTLRWLIEGSATHFDTALTLTLAELATADADAGICHIPQLPVAYADFNYADSIVKHKSYAERDVMSWIGSFTARLHAMNKERGGPQDADFGIVSLAIDDLLFATRIARYLGDRFRLEATSIQHTAIHFLQQIQLYLDLKAYRDDVNIAFQSRMAEIHAMAIEGDFRIHLICHSLGTVVCLRGLLDAAQRRTPWIKLVDRLVTFGSPIDLILLLYPKIFTPAGPQDGRPIHWTNYCLGNDPIATDLAIARSWVTTNAPGLFQNDAPDEVHLGNGSITAAHTEYCDQALMLNDIYENALNDADRSEQGDGIAPAEHKTVARRKRSVRSMFYWASLAAAILASGCIVLWWEENIKTDDAQRVVLGDPLIQLLSWCGLTAMVVSSVRGLAARSQLVALFWFLVCSITVVFLVVFMPGMPFCGGHFDANFPTRKNLIVEDWDYGNLVLGLLPIILAFHLLDMSPSRRRTKTATFQFGGLTLLTVFLSLFVGTRDNPSNLVDEFGLLAVTFGLWYLSLLLARIDHVFSSFVGDRGHLDTLAAYWKEKSHHQPPRAPYPLEKTPINEGKPSEGANGDNGVRALPVTTVAPQ